MMKTLRDIAFAGKKVLVRVDFNVPMNDAGQITDDLRIRTVLPTLQYLMAEKAKVIICTHMGRPKGQRVEKYSLAPVAAYTAQLLGCPVPLAPDCIGPEVDAAANSLGDGQLLMKGTIQISPNSWPLWPMSMSMTPLPYLTAPMPRSTV
jgi:phosphoglycerate kinase